MNTTNIVFPSNRVEDIERCFHTELKALYPRGEINQFINLLFEEYLDWDVAKRLLNRQQTINQSVLLRFHWALMDLKQSRPVQYIIGHTDFNGVDVAVNESVLIPRPETAEWVSNLYKNRNDASNILDLCTGSGCIAIDLAKHFPDAHTCGVDISKAALEVAKDNAQKNSINISWFNNDILKYESFCFSRKFDIITSNPPYVRQCERAMMSANVLNYEPQEALFVPDDAPLLFYKAIASIAKACLSQGGLLAVEINEFLSSETLELFRAEGFECDLLSDFNSKPRCVHARLKTC